jgi:hypothetical protein
MINFDAVQHNQFSSNLQKQNGFLMRLISSLIWAKKKFFVAGAHVEYKRYARAKFFFFIRKYLFSVGYPRVG